MAASVYAPTLQENPARPTRRENTIGGQVGRTAAALGHQAEDATYAVGSSMKSMGEAVRHSGPRGGILGSATASLASCLEQSGHYLQVEGLRGIGCETTNLIRRHPAAALLIGLGLGHLLARLTSGS